MTIKIIKNNNIYPYISKKDDIIKDSLHKLNQVKGLFQIIVDNDGVLLGTLTDGDIRRGILRGIDLNEPVGNFMNKDPKYSFKSNEEDYLRELEAVEREPFFLPIINKEKKLVHIVIKVIKKKINNAIIMAGGIGSRLGNLTKDLPKPMLQIHGRPIIDYSIKRLENENINNIYVSVNYLADTILDYLKKRKYKSKMIPVHEQKKLGTIGSLSLIKDNISEPILVMNADLLTSVSIDAMINFHINGNFSSTSASAIYENIIPCGVLEINKSGFLGAINEKPKISHMVAAGLYILNKEVYSLLNYNESCDMPDLLNLAIKNKMRNSIFPLHENWKDIGVPDEYFQAKTSKMKFK